MAFKGDPTVWPQHRTVHVPKSAALAALLTGPYATRAGLLAPAMPGSGVDRADPAGPAVTVLAHHVGPLADELAQALVRARDRQDPAVDLLAGVAAQLGVVEVRPVPDPVPAPGPRPVPVPAPAAPDRVQP